LKWLMFLAINIVIIQFVLSKVQLLGILGFVVKIIIITIIYMAMYILVYSRSEEFNYYIRLIKNLHHNKI
jgi:hypothetical protein